MILDEITKIDVSADGHFMFVGGLGVKKINAPTGKVFSVVKQGLPGIKISWLKSLVNKELIVQEAKNYDLYILDNDLQIKKKFKGFGGNYPDKETIRSCRFSYDDYMILWMSGMGGLTFLEPGKYEENVVDGFFGKGKSVMPICAISNKNGDKAIGLSYNNGILKFCYYEKKSGNKTKLNTNQINSNSKVLFNK